MEATGQPQSAPEGGTPPERRRRRRERPLLVVHTGHGKGKSTAAFGLMLRAWNQGWRIGVFQFI
ncbi:MAG: cob(I)yrinic acid a,c-diamide adenosyltransferase, partial [Actinomycetota bacterium]|nr:cob(I)yrinic acid a,c-diamide adenosyltransferase [Actinomycetota bacterium]